MSNCQCPSSIGSPSYTKNLFMFSKRVFILGPSHHVALPGCAITQTVVYETPLYNLKIDHKSKFFFFLKLFLGVFVRAINLLLYYI